MTKNRWNAVDASDSIQQERLCERSKQTVNASQDSIAEITYFEINRLCAYVKQILQANNMRRNSLLMNVQV